LTICIVTDLLIRISIYTKTTSKFDCRPRDAYSLNRNDTCSTEHSKRGLQGVFGPIVLSFWFMIFLNLQSFGERLVGSDKLEKVY
jgi:hypothetical protein